MKLLYGWLLESNYESLKEFRTEGIYNVDLICNIAIASLCKKPKLPADLCPPEDRNGTIEFLRHIWDNAEFLNEPRLTRYTQLLSSDHLYVTFCQNTETKVLQLLEAGKEVPELVLNTKQYSELIRQVYTTVKTNLIDGWIHPLSEFKGEEAANTWAIANIYAAKMANRYRGNLYKTSGTGIHISKLSPSSVQLIHNAKNLDSAYLTLINTIKHANEHLESI